MRQKIQWHPAFCSAMELELLADSENLLFDREYNLSSKPLQIDLLVVTKKKGLVLKSIIGKIFRIHNIMEFKSPRDSLGIDDYFKVLAYACLYKSFGTSDNAILAEEITVTLVRDLKPKKLLAWFTENGYVVEQPYGGIYYIRKEGVFATQVVVTSEISREESRWVSRLTENLTKQDMRTMVSDMQKAQGKHERECADAVLEVVMRANTELFHTVKEETDMCKALEELMAPEIEAIKQKILTEGLAEGRAKGLAEGRAEGESRLSSLISVLLNEKRFADVERAAKDEVYRQKLYHEYNL